MGAAVKKTISLPPELAREAQELARAEGKTLSAVVQDALRAARAARLQGEFRRIQGYWSRKAKEKGILTEGDLERAPLHVVDLEARTGLVVGDHVDPASDELDAQRAHPVDLDDLRAADDPGLVRHHGLLSRYVVS